MKTIEAENRFKQIMRENIPDYLLESRTVQMSIMICMARAMQMAIEDCERRINKMDIGNTPANEVTK